MSANIHIQVQSEPFDVNDELAALARDGVGAIATFTGYVRSDGGLTAMTLEHYPGMTEREIQRCAEEAASRWPLTGATVIHRVGRLKAGEPIVLVATASSHRAAAFEACEFLMDYLKTRAPFWKHEERPEGQGWVEAKTSDDKAAERWRGG